MSVKSKALETFEADYERSAQWLRGAIGLPVGQSAFPWQRQLLRRFLRGENIEALDIPPGLGKTATMAVWLVARALGEHKLSGFFPAEQAAEQAKLTRNDEHSR